MCPLNSEIYLSILRNAIKLLLIVSYSLLSLIFLLCTPLSRYLASWRILIFSIFISLPFYLLAVNFIFLTIYLMFYVPILIILRLSYFFFDCFLLRFFPHEFLYILILPKYLLPLSIGPVHAV